MARPRASHLTPINGKTVGCDVLALVAPHTASQADGITFGKLHNGGKQSAYLSTVPELLMMRLSASSCLNILPLLRPLAICS